MSADDFAEKFLVGTPALGSNKEPKLPYGSKGITDRSRVHACVYAGACCGWRLAVGCWGVKWEQKHGIPVKVKFTSNFASWP